MEAWPCIHFGFWHLQRSLPFPRSPSQRALQREINDRLICRLTRPAHLALIPRGLVRIEKDVRSGGERFPAKALVDLIRPVQLCPVRFREGHVGRHILFGIIHNGGEFRHFRSYLVGNIAPLGAGSSTVCWAKAVAMKAETTRLPLFPVCASTFLMNVNPASLPGGAENLGNGSLESLMGVGDDGLHAAQTSACKPAQELRSDRLGFGCADFHAQNLAPATGSKRNEMRPLSC